MPAPIALFAFNRPAHLARTLDALAANDCARESVLTIFCDGPRTEAEKTKTDAVRVIAHEEVAKKRFASVRVVEQEKNQGLAASIIAGVSRMLEESERVVVLEDDLVTSPYFLRFMNDGLALYQDSASVATIQGYCFPHAVVNPPDTFFLQGADCWGWATWRRAWLYFEPDAYVLLRKITEAKASHAFDVDGTYPYTEMLRAQLEGRVNSWAIRWQASAWLNNMYSLYPSTSLVFNNGMDASGTHCGVENVYSVPLMQQPVSIKEKSIQQDAVMYAAVN